MAMTKFCSRRVKQVDAFDTKMFIVARCGGERVDTKVITMNTYTHGETKTLRIISACVCRFLEGGLHLKFHKRYVMSFYTGQKVTAPLCEKNEKHFVCQDVRCLFLGFISRIWSNC